MPMTEQEKLLGDQVYQAIQQASNGSERSQQQQDFNIGVSDVGVCPERVRRMLAGIPEPITDKLSAFVGTAVGDHVERAVAVAFPEALIQTVVSVALSGGRNDYLLTGHPDIVQPWGVIDVKTVYGLEATRRTGPTFGQLFQRHAYTKGAHDAGLLSVPLEEARTANIWIDRSGRTKEPFVHMDTYNSSILQDGAFWLDEVYYAYEHGVAAEKSPPREWCKVACGHFEDCRLYDSDVTGLLTDEKVLAAIEMHQEGKALKKEGERLQDEAKPILEGIEGYTNEFQLRWTHINEAPVPAYTRSGYSRLNITKRRGA